MKVLVLYILVVAIGAPGVISKTIVKRSPELHDFHAGYFHNNGKSITAGIAGQNNIYRNPGNQHEQQMGYFHAGYNDQGIPSANAEIGVHRASGHIDETGIGGSTWNTKFLSAGAEVGAGAMGRASIADATMNIGHVGFNAGIGFDTGAIVNDAVEVKVLGIGGKVGKDGIQGCFILCLGFNW